MDLFNYIWNNWFIVAFIAPIFWAIINLLDVYFVNAIYHDEWDGVILSDLIQIIPCIIIFVFLNGKLPFLSQNDLQGIFFDRAIIFALIGGFIFSISGFFYFRALFIHDDVALIQIFWNLCILVVPFLSLIFFHEVLPGYNYLGMIITLIGTTILSFSQTIRKKISTKFFINMIGAVFFLSFSMIIEKKAFGILDTRHLGEKSFWIGYFYFSLGSVLNGILVMILIKRNIFNFINKFFIFFIFAEGLSLIGTITSQRAINISPSTSFVATIEGFVPVFVLIWSLLIIGILYLTHNYSKRAVMARLIYKEQLHGGWLKIVSLIIMLVGIYLIQ